MAYFIESENRNFRVLSINRAEAVGLLRDLMSQLIMASGGAAQVTIHPKVGRVYQLLFQVDTKPPTQSGITVEEELGPVFLESSVEE